MIISTLIIYNKLILFSGNNIGPNRIGLKISLKFDRIIYLSYRLYKILFERSSLLYVLIFFYKPN